MSDNEKTMESPSSAAEPAPAAAGSTSPSSTPAAADDAAAPVVVNKTGHRCYVGNLSWAVSSEDLEEHMKSAGEVVSAEVMTGYDGRSKGCGIVEFLSVDAAKEAISTLTDTDLKGRMIFVREDREMGTGGRGGGRGGRGGRGNRNFNSGGRGGGRGGGGYGGGGRRGGGDADDEDDADADESGNNNGSCSVYVGNLAFETSWQDLKDHMRGAGNVDQAKVLTADGRSKGCGIVQYQRPQDAARAIRELQNSELDGRPIFVREDREQGGRRGGGGRGGNRNSRPDSSEGGGGAAGTQLFVGNLSFDTSWKELKDHFRQCGEVERAEVVEGNNGRKKGFGTVRFFKQEDATNAIESLNGIELQGRALAVRLDHKAN